MEQSATPLTGLLKADGTGDPQAASDILPLVYDELRRLASAYLAKTPPGNTLQATALVHEAYMRLIGAEDPGWDGRRHFFGAAAQAMRNILVEQARRKASARHGGGRQRYDIADADLATGPPADDLLALNEALTKLESTDPRKAEIVMLHHFAGLTLDETAAAIGCSLSTVEREWRFTRALLFSQIVDSNGHP